jgi:hypothetical protein
MTDEYCCGQHAGRHRIALSDQRRAASTIARAQGSGRKITEAMRNSLETAKRGVAFAQENIEAHFLAMASEKVA